MSLKEELELDISPALRGIDRVGAELSAVGDRFGVSISRALDKVRTGQEVKITADTTEITPELEGAVDAADTTATIDVHDESIDQAKTKARELGSELEAVKKIAAQIGVAFGVREIGQFFASSVQAASDLAESTNKARAVFRDGADEVLAFGKTAATSVGLASQEAIEAAGTFGNLFTSLGLGRGVAGDMSIELVKLAADLASFNNIPIDEALERLRSGLVGEVEPLRRMGVSFNAAQVEAKALQLGLADANGTVSEAAKVQARYALVMEQTKNAQGDFARTSDQLANTQRILKAQFTELKVSVGNELLPEILKLTRTGSSDLLPLLERMTVAIGKGLGSTISGVTPLLAVLVQMLEAIPAPLLAGAIQSLALSKGLSAIGLQASPMLRVLGALLPILSSLDSGLGSAVISMVAFGAVGERVGGKIGASIGVIGGLTQAVAGADSTAGKAIGSTLGFAAAGAQIAGPYGAAAGAVIGFGSALLTGGESVEEYHDKIVKLAEEIRGLGRDKSAVAFIESLGEEEQFALLASGLDNSAEKVARLRHEFQDLAKGSPTQARVVLEGLRQQGLVTGQEFERFSAIIDKTAESMSKKTAAARETEAADAAIAAQAGLTSTAIEDQIARMEASITTGVPPLGDVFDGFASDVQSAFGTKAVPSVDGFINRLTATAGEIETWNAQVTSLLLQGLTGLAALVQSQGPVIGGGLATEIQNATPETRTQWENQVNAGTKALEDGKTRSTVLAKATATAVVKAIDAPRADGTATTSGRGTGHAFGDGLTQGIDSKIPSVRAAAIRAVAAAKAAADQEARAHSPSLLFAELGENIALGLAAGIDSGSSSVVQAAEQIVRDAALASGLSAGGAGALGGITIGKIEVEVTGAVDPAQGRAAGEEIAGGIASGLARRKLVVAVRTGGGR